MHGSAIETDRHQAKTVRRRSATDRLAERMARTRVFGHRIDEVWAGLRRRRAASHWTSLFGVVSAAALVVVTVTGVLLMFFYTPSGEPTTYGGSYAPLHGVEVSQAFASTMRVTFDVPGGQLLRQSHHWAGLLLPASIVVQLMTTFFTGGFRRPRRAMWVLLLLAFITVLATGWSGYALPDDMLSGTGLRIVEGIMLGIPVVGTALKTVLFGGPFPGRIIENLYPLHTVVFPVALLLFVALRGVALSRHGVARFPGGHGAAHDGLPLIPTAAARSGGLFLVVTALLVMIGATVTVSPIWLHGPADPGSAGAGSQPDWYTGFLDGALRLVPPGWEIQWLGRTWTLAILAPLAVVGAFFVVVALYPFLEAWVIDDRGEHDVLDRPRVAPTRTGIGVAGLVFAGVLWAAGGADVIAGVFSVSLEQVILSLQCALVVGPFIAFSVARRVCLGLQRKDRELLDHGYETGRIVRLPGGEYIDVRHTLDDTERMRIAVPPPPPPPDLGPDRRGTRSVARRLRARLWALYAQDRVAAEPLADRAQLPVSRR
ncbi:cytochrome b [Microbacterium ureisolvens]|nr:cytochrome b N-terminal domain-containing protein [Microbacterium ureisolvens]